MSEQVHKSSEQVREEAIARMMEEINELEQMARPVKIKVRPDFYFKLRRMITVSERTSPNTIYGMKVEIDKEMKKEWEVIYE